MDNAQKTLVLRYAQLVFKNELGSASDVEKEKAEIRQRLNMTHEQILRLAEENLIEKFD